MAGGTRTLRAIIVGDSASAEQAFARTSLAARAAADETEGRFNAMTSNVGGLFSRIGQFAESQLGIPIGGALDKVGSKFEEADNHGGKFMQTMSTLGGATLLGAAAGFAAVAVESVHLADGLDTAESSLKTAITNTGGNFEQLKPKIDETYSSMAHLGFNSTEVARSLTQLTTATGSPTAAMKDLSIAADLARLKHVSLEEATSVLTKTMAGSTRALTQMGLNLDIGSAKLSSAHTATLALDAAELHMQQTEENVASGKLKGAAATQALETAHLALARAQDTVNRDGQAQAQILDALREKTHGAAADYGQTLPGQMQIAEAEAKNLGASFGQFLVPKIEDVLHATMDVVDWFERHKAVAEALAATIGTVLAGAVVIYAINLGQKAVDATKNAIQSISNLTSALFGQTSATEAATVATNDESAADDLLAASQGRATVASEDLGTAQEGLAAKSTLAGDSIGASGLAGKAGLAEGALGGGGLGGVAEGLGVSLVGLGGIALVAAGAIGGITYAILNSSSKWNPIQGEIDKASGSIKQFSQSVQQMPTATPGQLTTDIDNLSQKSAQLAQNMAKVLSGSEGSGGNVITALDAIHGKFDVAYQSTLKFAQGLEGTDLASDQASANIQILSQKFGTNADAVNTWASQTGTDLKTALNPAQVQSFAAYLQSSNTVWDQNATHSKGWASSVAQSSAQAQTTIQTASELIGTTTTQADQMMHLHIAGGSQQAWSQFISTFQGGIGQAAALYSTLFDVTPAQAMAILEQKASETGTQTPQRLGDGMNSNSGAASNGAVNVAQAVNGVIGGLPGQAYNTGTQIPSQLEAGINAAIGSIAGSIATGVANAVSSGVSQGAANGAAALSMINLTANAGRATATGGIFTSPEVRLIGEAGPEAVLPLNDPGRIQQLLAGYYGGSSGFSGGTSNPSLIGGGGAGAPLNVNVSLTVNATTGDPAQLAQQLAEPLRQVLLQTARNLPGQSLFANYA